MTLGAMEPFSIMGSETNLAFAKVVGASIPAVIKSAEVTKIIRPVGVSFIRIISAANQS